MPKSLVVGGSFMKILLTLIENKIFKRKRGICLLSNLFGRAEDLVSSIEELIPDSDGARKLIVDCIYKRDPLYVVTLVFTEH